METKPARKKLIMISCSIAATVIALGVVLFLTVLRNKDRKITLLELTGTVQVERGGNTIAAEKGMKLKTGDILVSGEGSSARIRIDDDKFLYVDASSRVSIQADGTAKESHTVIFVEKGALLTEVKRKLSERSTFLIVTPNTSMSIHGTKTLTEVLEDILGAIKTNAAVVEGQVSFKTVSKDSTGKMVVTPVDLRAGQGVGVSTDSKDLLSAEDVKHITDDGQIPADSPEALSVKESGNVLETPVFGEEFLTNVVAVLARSREEDVEEGFAAEDVTEEELNAAINTLNDVIDGKTELPPAVEAYLLNQAQPNYSETIITDSPETGNAEEPGDDTFKIEGNEELIGVGGEADPDASKDAGSQNDADSNTGAKGNKGDTGAKDKTGKQNSETGTTGDKGTKSNHSDQGGGDDSGKNSEPKGDGDNAGKQSEPKGDDGKEPDSAENDEDQSGGEEEPEDIKVPADPGSNGTGTDVGTGTETGTDAGNVGHGTGVTSGEEEPEKDKGQQADAGADAEAGTAQQGSTGVQVDIVSKADDEGKTNNDAPSGHDILKEDVSGALLAENVHDPGFNSLLDEGGGGEVDITVDPCTLGQHDYELHDAKAPTCTEAGWEAYQTCKNCTYTTYKEIPATGHTLENHNAKAPTCTEAGWEAYQTCNKCNYTTYKEITATGHVLENHDGKAATCTEDGWEAYQTCKNCTFTTYKKVPASGHNYGNWESTVKPGPVYEDGCMTAWHAGRKIRKCEKCSATEEATILVTPALRCELYGGDVKTLPVDIFTDSYYAEGMGANATLNDFTMLFFVSSPIVEGDFVNLDAGVQWINGDTLVSSLKEGDTVQVKITMAEQRDVYTDTDVTIKLTAPEFTAQTAVMNTDEEIGVTEVHGEN